MGIMQCARYGCGNVCCKYLFYSQTYVCEECVAELKQEFENSNVLTCTEKYFDKKFSKFLRTEKGHFHLKTKKDKTRTRIDTLEYIDSCFL